MYDLPFTPRQPPLSHQGRYLSEDARRKAYALFWEQGTGKTYAIINNVAVLAVEAELDACFVLAPNGVHRNWHVEEIPKWWPDDPKVPPYRSMSWDTTKAANKSHQEEFRALMDHKGVAFLCMSYDGLMTDPGKQASWDFIRKHKKVLYAGDESQRFKTAAAKRTKRVIASSPYAEWRRIASGTPMDKPFDIYSQIRFLDPDFWGRVLALGSYTAFKTYFAEFIQQTLAGGRSFPMLIGYKNLPQLNEAITQISSRVLKEDVLDLPPKTYKRVFHELTREQKIAYKELQDEALTFLETGEMVTADFALTLQLRLSQIGCGFIRPEVGAADVPFSRNPRAEMLQTILEDLTRPAIIWHLFQHDAKVIAEASKAAGRRPVIFDGNDPAASLDPFHAGEADDLIGNLASGLTEGHTLNEADTTIYYSRSSKLIPRLQSEDRNHRIGQGLPVTIIDLLAEHTLDSKVLKDLREKRDLTGTTLGDARSVVSSWLREAD